MISSRRLSVALRTDLRLQARNQLYPISVMVSLVCAALLARLAPPDHRASWIPAAVVLFAGGSTLLYVIAMVLMEREAGTLEATTVSPMRPAEYLMAKVLSLAGLGAAESLLIGAGALLGQQLLGAESPPSLLLLAPFVLAALLLAVIHVEVGLLVAFRYRSIMPALLPMSLAGVVLQLPAFHLLGALDAPSLLALPSGPPCLIIRGLLQPAGPSSWAWGIAGSLLYAGLGWALAVRAYRRWVVRAPT